MSNFVSVILASATFAFFNPVNAEELRYSNAKYNFTVSLPKGWVQIPSVEVARLKEGLPPQAQHLIYEAAFQRGKKTEWFQWPYIIIQIIPSDRTKIRRLPTEAEFEKMVSLLSGGRALIKAKEVFDAVADPYQKAMLSSLIPSLTAPSVQTDMANRKFRFVADGSHLSGPMRIYTAAAFQPDGHVVQINAYTGAATFQQDLGDFVAITQSMQTTSKH